MKRILFAHQSTIPHYRVPFYNALQQRIPNDWCFDVVFDSSEVNEKRFFQEPLDVTRFTFPTVDTRTYLVKLGSKKIKYQTFWLKAAKYDLIIVGGAMDNLTYPLCQLHQLHQTKFAYWGHAKNRRIANPNYLRVLFEKFRMILHHKADGIFAYTQGVKLYLESQGIAAQNIFVFNNTIDIDLQHRVYKQLLPNREKFRQEQGLNGKKVILFVGRYTKNKRISFLLDSFSILASRDDSFHLLLVGSGVENYPINNHHNISTFGPIVDIENLGSIYVASDIFSFPGAVGLGPLQALCFNLPVVTIDSPTHMPEFEYLSPANSIILPENATPELYAQTILNIFQNNPNDDNQKIGDFKSTIWPSIRHLTIDQMANNFIEGINTLLYST